MKAGWEVKPLGEVAKLHYGKALAKAERNPEGSVPVFGANGILGWSDHVLTEGPSLIVGRKGSAGEVNRVDGPFWPSDVTVRRQGFWNQWQLKLRESSAHLVGLIMRRVVCDASVAFRVSFV